MSTLSFRLRAHVLAARIRAFVEADRDGPEDIRLDLLTRTTQLRGALEHAFAEHHARCATWPQLLRRWAWRWRFGVVVLRWVLERHLR